MMAAETGDRVAQLFQSIDNRDIDAFLAFLSADVLFRFGNAQPVKGKDGVRTAVNGFFESVKALRHELIGTWQKDDVTICHGMVTYTRHDSTTLRVPFANILKLDAGSIKEYLIYVDISGLYKSVK